MPAGIHAEVAIDEPDACQVAPYSERDGKTVTAVTKVPAPDADSTVVEEFTRTSERAHVETDGGLVEAGDGADKLFEAGEKEVFRFRRPTPQPCVCEYVERHGCPVREVSAVRGTLHVTFVAPDHDVLQTVLEDLASVYDEMGVCRLLRTEEEGCTDQTIILDVSALTDRQREVLETAHEMGYFEHPRETNATDVAAALDITKSTFAEHLAAAQRNLLDELLDDQSGPDRER